MISVDRIKRLIETNHNKYFTDEKNKVLSTPEGITFDIFFQLLCQDLNLYSRALVQNNQLNKSELARERTKLMIVHEELDKVFILFNKYKKEITPNEPCYTSKKNRFFINKKDLKRFIEKILLESLLNIENKTEKITN